MIHYWNIAIKKNALLKINYSTWGCLGDLVGLVSNS